MCGIIGSVGITTDIKSSYTILTYLMQENQRRGPHATGHFAVEKQTNDTLWFKSPVPSKIYTGLSEWKIFNNIYTKALIGHSRYKTNGNEYNNINNHPHISISGNIGLVHNGTIYKFEEIKSNFNLLGESDSEILLAIIINEKNILNGIKKIYEFFGVSGDFACEVIYRNPENGNTKFFFFRDPGRPGRFIDARKELGQIFFCSTNSIWKDAIKKAEIKHPQLSEYNLKNIDIEIIPSFQIWEIDSQTVEITKYDIEKPTHREKKIKQKPKKNITAYERWKNKIYKVGIK